MKEKTDYNNRNLIDSLKDTKIIAFDLDGTLLEKEGRLFPGTAEEIRRLKKNGMHLYIATGRSVQSFKKLEMQELFIENFSQKCICNDGNVIYDLVDQTVDVINSLNANYYYEYFNNNKHLFEFVIESDGIFFADKISEKIKPEYQDYFFYNNEVELINLNKFKPNSISQLFLFPKSDIPIEEIEKQTNIEYEDSLMYYYGNFINIRPISTSKSRGLKYLLNKNSLSEVMAIGDGLNDETLLRDAQVGIATQNSEPGLREIADINLSVDIAKFLNNINSIIAGVKSV